MNSLVITAFARQIVILWAVLLFSACAPVPASSFGTTPIPDFRVDPMWPQPLAEKDGVQQIFGQVAGIA